MSKQIEIEYGGRTYTLEFTRKSVRRLEDDGLAQKFSENKNMDACYALFKGALYAHHRNIDSRIVDEMFDKLGDLGEWTEDLTEMYKDTFAASANDSEGEIKRMKNW